jgi:predicted DNA-binding protein (UPF0278 family)
MKMVMVLQFFELNKEMGGVLVSSEIGIRTWSDSGKK